MKHSEAIDWFRKSEDVESVLVLLGKESSQVNLRKVALAFAKVPVKRHEEKDLDEGPELWEQLWDAVQVDLDQLGRISGTRSECARYVEMLKGYRLIYPDGTLSTVAQKALKALTKAELGL
jgi:hypothetical protein